MSIRNKHNGIVVYPAIVYRNGAKCARFSGVTIKIDSNNFRKHWEII